MITSSDKQMITMEYVDTNGDRHRVQVDVNGMATDFLDTFRAFLYVCGFHADTIADLLNDEEIK